MKRKVVKQGTNTLTISLPQDWSRKYNIQNGDELDLDEDNNNLIIKTSSDKFYDRRTIELGELRKLVNILIIQSYKDGADEIKIISNEVKPDDLKRVLDESIGYEIISSDNNSIIIKDLSGSSNHDFNTLFRRVLFLLQTILDESYEALKDNDKEAVSSLIEKDLDINKFSSHCIRTLSKNKVPKDKEKYLIMHEMEELGDFIKDIHKKVLKHNIEVDNKILETIFQSKLFFDQCHEFYFNPKRNKALEIANNNESLRKKIDQLMEELEGKQLLLLPPLYSLVNKIVSLQRLSLSAL